MQIKMTKYISTVHQNGQNENENENIPSIDKDM